MCFYNGDADWYAAVTEETDTIATMQMHCMECGIPIQPGEFVHTLYQQESEGECVTCEQGDCDCKGECCKCITPNFGETYDYQRCECCDKFLRAVEAAEIEAGCSKSDARPQYGGMIDDIANGEIDDAKKYWKKARAMFPELVLNGYLAGLWRRTFGYCFAQN